MPCRVDTPDDCARLIGNSLFYLEEIVSKFRVIPSLLKYYHFTDANLKLELGTGMLIAVPIPKEHSASGNLIESAIQTALREARWTCSACA